MGEEARLLQSVACAHIRPSMRHHSALSSTILRFAKAYGKPALLWALRDFAETRLKTHPVCFGLDFTRIPGSSAVVHRVLGQRVIQPPTESTHSWTKIRSSTIYAIMYIYIYLFIYL